VVYGSSHFAVGKNNPVEALRLGVGTPSSEQELITGATVLRQLLREKR